MSSKVLSSGGSETVFSLETVFQKVRVHKCGFSVRVLFVWPTVSHQDLPGILSGPSGLGLGWQQASLACHVPGSFLRVSVSHFC